MEATRPSAPGGVRAIGASLGFWISRYAPQDLAAGGALVLAGLLMRGTPPLLLASVCAAAELVTFYGVSFLRQRRAVAGRARSRRTVVRMLREYGPSEALDLGARPFFMAVAATLLDSSLLGIVAASCAADLVFYAGAALRHRLALGEGDG